MGIHVWYIFAYIYHRKFKPNGGKHFPLHGLLWDGNLTNCRLKSVLVGLEEVAGGVEKKEWRTLRPENPPRNKGPGFLPGLTTRHRIKIG